MVSQLPEKSYNIKLKIIYFMEVIIFFSFYLISMFINMVMLIYY